MIPRATGGGFRPILRIPSGLVAANEKAPREALFHIMRGGVDGTFAPSHFLLQKQQVTQKDTQQPLI